MASDYDPGSGIIMPLGQVERAEGIVKGAAMIQRWSLAAPLLCGRLVV